MRAGYRHIDTAHAYYDEPGVGRAVKTFMEESGTPREGIWITSKLWPTEYGEGKTLEAIDKMLKRMQLDYIDLYYQHRIDPSVEPEAVADTMAWMMNKRPHIVPIPGTRHLCRLKNKSLTFVEISDMFGFSSPAYFSRYVQQDSGIRPSDYRK